MATIMTIVVSAALLLIATRLAHARVSAKRIERFGSRHQLALLPEERQVNAGLVGLQQQISDNTGMVQECGQWVCPRLRSSGTRQVAQ
jgi:hypothetical protein